MTLRHKVFLRVKEIETTLVCRKYNKKNIIHENRRWRLTFIQTYLEIYLYIYMWVDILNAWTNGRITNVQDGFWHGKFSCTTQWTPFLSSRSNQVLSIIIPIQWKMCHQEVKTCCSIGGQPHPCWLKTLLWWLKATTFVLEILKVTSHFTNWVKVIFKINFQF